MKIAFFSTLLRYGGDVTRNIQVARRISKNNEIIFFNSENTKKFKIRSNTEFRLKFLKDIKFPLINLLTPYYYLPRNYLIFQNFDIIHSSTYRLNLLAIKIKKEFGIPFLQTIHIIPQIDYTIKNLITYPIINDWMRLTSKNADVLIVPSKYTHKLLRKKYHVSSLVIPNGITVDNFLKSPDLSVKKELKLENKKIILFVGQIRESKGIHILIKSLKKVKEKYPEIFLLIVGRIPTTHGIDYVKFLIRIIEDNKLRNSVRFLLDVSDELLKSIYSIADIFVLPSLYFEYQGIVLLEAMVSNVPVIGSITEGIPEMIKNEKNGLLFEKGNSDDLSDKIIKLIDDKELRDNLIEKANLIIDQKYNWDIIAEQIINLYKKYNV